MSPPSRQRPSPTRIADQINEWSAQIRGDASGARFLEAADGKALAQLRVPPGQSGIAAAGTILTLGHAAALAASASTLDPTGELAPDGLPVTLQLSVNVFRGAGRGTLTADAQTVYRGRSTLVVDVKVRDEQGGLVATLAVTQLAPAGRRALGRGAARIGPGALTRP